MKQKVATILFMVMGFAGLILQMYKYYSGDLSLDIHEFALSIVFTVFVWKPRTLVSLFDRLVSRFFLKNKN